MRVISQHIVLTWGGAWSNFAQHSLAMKKHQLLGFLERAAGRTVVLTGAGISTASGIPDYRGPQGVYVRNKNFRPIQYQQFVGEHASRQRYWARSFLGWPKIHNCQPNTAHFALTKLQQERWISNIITQNVDHLHTKSGADHVLEIHGSLGEIQCINPLCGHTMDRQLFQERLALLNPKVALWSAKYGDNVNNDVASSVNPDGDAEITWSYDEFAYGCCTKCGGIMKPRVVFFGENVPAPIRNKSFQHIDEAKALLVVGSSLQVHSALRLVQRAHQRGIPVAIINLGSTRGDALSSLKVEGSCVDILSQVTAQLR